MQRAALVLVGLLVPCLAGCGGADDGPPRFQVSGAVKFQNAPVPAGEIVFEPDGDANNKGPSTRVAIANGVYSTKTDKVKGIIGGPMIVRIIGYDGKPAADAGTQVHGKPLFKEHVEKLDLPKADTTKDFEVPAKK